MKFETLIFFAGLLSISTVHGVLQGWKEAENKHRIPFYINNHETIQGFVSQIEKGIRGGYVFQSRVEKSLWEKFKNATKRHCTTSLIEPYESCPAPKRWYLLSPPPLVFIRRAVCNPFQRCTVVRLVLAVHGLGFYGHCNSDHGHWTKPTGTFPACDWEAKFNELTLDVVTTWTTIKHRSTIHAVILDFKVDEVYMRKWDKDFICTEEQMFRDHPWFEAVMNTVKWNLKNSDEVRELIKSLVSGIFY